MHQFFSSRVWSNKRFRKLTSPRETSRLSPIMQRELVILTSSPVLIDNPLELPHNQSSSDFEVSALDKRLKSGNHTSSIPQNASVGFQKASQLPRTEEVSCSPVRQASKQIPAGRSENGSPEKKTTRKPRKKKVAVPEEAAAASILEEEQIKPVTKRGRPRKDASEKTQKIVRKKSTKATAEKEILESGKENCGLVTIDLTNTESPTKRKARWTPPPATMIVEGDSHGGPPADMRKAISGLGFQQENVSCSVTTATVTEPSMLKRKRIELVHAGKSQLTEIVPVALTSPTKKPSPKKKPKTITDIAVEKYLPDQSKRFEGDQQTTAINCDPVVPTIANDSLPVLKAARKTSKSSRKQKVAGKKKEVAKSKLISPLSAMRRLQAQNMTFGTSSQLAVPESSDLRQLQQALDLSVLDTSKTESRQAQQTLRKFRFANATSTILGSRWDAGALPEDNIVLEQESAAAQDNPSLHLETKQEISKLGENSEAKQVTSVDDSAEFEDIDELSFIREEKRKATLNQSSHAIPDCLPPIPLVEVMHKEASATFPPDQSLPVDQPLQHTKQLNMTAGKVKSPKRSKKPKSSDTKPQDEFIPIEAIEDSEPNLTPSPPRMKNPTETQLPLVTTPAPKLRRLGKKGKWDILKVSLFPLITSTVMHASPSQGPEMNWYEKMLMYEPIMLEAFTAWLTDQGIKARSNGATNEEKGVEINGAELQTWMVREWCEDNSVCCLSKFTNRKELRK